MLLVAGRVFSETVTNQTNTKLPYEIATWNPEDKAPKTEFPRGNSESIQKPQEEVSTQATEVSGDCLSWIKEAGITDVENAMILINRESGCNPFAKNQSSGAYGIPQSLPGEKMASEGDDWETNPVTQLKWMQSYVIGRYGNWSNAVSHSNTHGWY